MGSSPNDEGRVGVRVSELEEYHDNDEGGGQASAAGGHAGCRPSAHDQFLLDMAADILLAPTPEPEMMMEYDQQPTDDQLLSRFQLLIGTSPADYCGRPESETTAVSVALRINSRSFSPDPDGACVKATAAAIEKLSNHNDKKKEVKGGDGPRMAERNNATLRARKRREKISQKLKALGNLVPTSHESDNKASLLEKAIEHIKQLQAQKHMTDMANSGGGGGGGGALLQPPAEQTTVSPPDAGFLVFQYASLPVFYQSTPFVPPFLVVDHFPTDGDTRAPNDDKQTRT